MVPVTFSGTATQNEDYTASAESIQIDSGTSGSLVLSITDDGQTEEDESILVTLGAPESNAVLGSVIEQEVSIVSTAVAPKVSLAAQVTLKILSSFRNMWQPKAPLTTFTTLICRSTFCC